MANYKAPLDDIRFVAHDLLDLTAHYPALQEVEAPDRQTFDLMLEQGGRFSEQVLHPLYRSGDETGCDFNGGNVKLPKGYGEAREQWVEAGWPGLTAATRWGGQALPRSVGIAINEMLCAVNPPWVMLVGLPSGVMMAIDAHGAEWQRERFFPGLVDGRFSATMCLTEPHCGTDLGILRSKAEPQADGTYKISGTKIFISYGEHDCSENIIHLVLAKLPDAPAGSAGISMFIVPKFLVNEDQSLGERNAVSCGSIEHKMGYAASPTCVMNFDGAIGYMVGEPHQGLKYMFVMMNDARIGSGMAGLGLATASYQGALSYARERLQMRSLSGPKNSDGVADPIIVHPGVRQLLLTQKAFTEGCRALCLDTARYGDLAEYGADADVRKTASRRLGFLTPIVKGFVTEVSNECVSHGVQVLGGHGYIREHGMEQLMRDCRVSTIYEGTTQVQALDLIGRKIMMDQGRAMRELAEEIDAFCAGLESHARIGGEAKVLRTKLVEWQQLAAEVGAAAMKNPDEAGAASVDFLMYSGYVVVGWYWLRLVLAAEQKLASDGDADFCNGKFKAAAFFFARLLPRTQGLATAIRAGADSMMSFADAEF
jgi:alkylation response protein AidB-like acyl-CoA dehydrogenase